MSASVYHKDNSDAEAFTATQAIKEQSIDTPTGIYLANKGDWIVRHPAGGRMVYSDPVFKAMFRQAPGGAAPKQQESE